MNVAVVFSDLSHYHHARFAAASKLLTPHVIEVGGHSSFKEFKWHGSEAPFEIRTLFPNLSYWEVLRGRGVASRELASTLYEALDAAHPDVVALKGYSFLDSFIAMRWCRARGVPYFVMSETQASDFARSEWKEATKRMLLRDCSAALVGGTPHVEYMQSLGIPRRRIVSGYDAVDNEHFARGADEARAHAEAGRARLGLPEEYFLAAARFIAKKNLATLLRAYSQYRRASDCSTAWELVLVGDGPLRGSLETLCNELGVTDSVHFHGFQSYDVLPRFYGLASAFVHPSTREQWGLVVNEAMAAGLPVIVSQQSGCSRDLVKPGRNGATFDARDAGALAQALTEVSRDNSAATSMGSESRRIISHWSPERFGRGFARAAQIAADHPRTSPALVHGPLTRVLEWRAARVFEEE